MALYGYKPKTKPANWKQVALRDQPLERGKPVKLPKKMIVAYAIKSLAATVNRVTKPLRKRIAPRSRRMSKLMAFYNERKAAFLREHPNCAVHKAHKHPATQIHHSRGRAGTLLLDERFWFGVCDAAHHWIGERPADARADGFLCAAGLWNTPPQDAETERLRALVKELTK